MAVDLVNLIKVSLTPDVVQKAAAFIGESESATQKSVNAIVLTLVAAMTTQVSTTIGGQQLARALDAGGYDEGARNALGGLFLGKQMTRKAVDDGKRVLNTLLGTKTNGLAHLIARDTGIPPDSVSSLMALVVPLAMYTLGCQRSTVAAGPASLAALLREQNGDIGDLLPIGVAPLLGWTDYESVRDQEVSYAESNCLAPSWLFAVLILTGLLVLGLAWLVGVLPTPVGEAAGPARLVVKTADLPPPGRLKTSVFKAPPHLEFAQQLSAGISDNHFRKSLTPAVTTPRI